MLHGEFIGRTFFMIRSAAYSSPSTRCTAAVSAPAEADGFDQAGRSRADSPPES